MILLTAINLLWSALNHKHDSYDDDKSVFLNILVFSVVHFIQIFSMVIMNQFMKLKVEITSKPLLTLCIQKIRRRIQFCRFLSRVEVLSCIYVLERLSHFPEQ